MLAYLLPAASISRQAGTLGSHFTELIQCMAKLGSWEPNSQFRASITDQPLFYREGTEEIEYFDTVPVCLPHFISHCRGGYTKELCLVRYAETCLQTL